METLVRFFEAPAQSFFLFGPRGTGKSTWLRQAFPQALYLDLLRPELHRELGARPERLRERVLGAPDSRVVVVDEVQRVPELLAVVHELAEARAGRRFVLTGSSARKLRRGGVDLLAGRALHRTLHPFMAAEMPAFRLEDALRSGLLPLVLSSEDPAGTLAAYAALYLEQEVQVEGWARRVGDFARFLEAISFSHGAVLNVSNVARECEVQARTAMGYVEVLEDLLLSFRVPVFARRARRERTAHPKFYLFDAGVFRSLRPRGPLDRPEEIEGAALEGLVAQHLRAWIAYSGREATLSFWRTRSGVEVDFVVYGPGVFVAIQVQNSRRVRPADVAALEAFRSDFPEATALLLYRGEDRLRLGDVHCRPVEEFLRQLHPGRELAEVTSRSGSRGRSSARSRPA